MLNVIVIISVILHVTGEPPPQAAAAGNQFIQGKNLSKLAIFYPEFYDMKPL